MTFGLALGITKDLSRVSYLFNTQTLGTDDYRLFEVGPSLTVGSWTDADQRPASLYSAIIQANWKSLGLSPSKIRETPMRFDFTICVRLYGHGFNSVTSPLTFIALFLHVATVLNHILVTSFWTS